MYLCYGKPASMDYAGWEEEALPLGNGKIGAKVFGGDECELISFNEKTLWSGGPDAEGYNQGISNPDHGKAMREIQALLAKGDTKKATAKMKELQGNHNAFGAYQAFGSLYIAFDGEGKTEKYARDLDLSSASAMVTYKKGAVTYTRHYFVSYPDNVFVGRIKSEDGEFSFDAYFVSEQGATCVADGDTITLQGTVNANIGINGKPGKDKNNMKHAACFRFISNGGKLTAEGDHIKGEKCTSLTIIGSLATDYVNNYPVFSDGSNPLEKAEMAVNKAAINDFPALYRTHLQDYRAIFNRVAFTLGEGESGLTTDSMLKRFAKAGEYKRNLVTLLFQYGRYLAIASSREGSLPSNLQGVWNAKNNPMWESDYHLNINLQMNYWPAYTANMTETALPLIEFVDSLRKPGRIVAGQTMGIGDGKDYNKATGWVAHTTVSPLGNVAPGFDWRWGWAPVNGAWLAIQLMEYYNFTLDAKKLADDIYPIMEEAALLWSQLLVERKDGTLAVSPCFSPEHGPVSEAGTFEQSIIYNLFKNVIRVSKILFGAGYADRVNSQLIEKISNQIEHIKPYALGGEGQLKEWEHEDGFSRHGRKEGVEKGHRHLSHLLGVYPFDDITHEEFVLQRAAKHSLADRGKKAPAWAMTHRLLCYARLGDGKTCDDLIEKMLKKSFLNNLFSNHPPFQVDGNFGFTAAICEMLVQSHEDFIRILPALPRDWPSGKVEGILARGGFEISLEWKDNMLKGGTVKSLCGGKCSMVQDGKIIIVYDENDKEIDVDFSDKGVSSFMTEKGKTYRIS